VLLYIAEYSHFFCLLSLLLWLPGLVLTRTVFRHFVPASLRPLTSVCLGLAVWIATAFVLSATGQLRSAWAAGLCIVWLCLAFAFHSRLGIREAAAQIRSAISISSVSRGAVLAVLLAPCFIVAMSPEVAWDAGTYHLTLPKLYIEHHGFRPVEMSIYSNWPLNTEMLFSVAMLLKDYILATMLHFGFGVLTLYGIFTCCRVFNQGRGAWLAVLLFLTNHIVLWEMTVAYIDLAYAFFFLAGLIFTLRAIEEPADRRPMLLLSGLCGGILIGVKLSGIFGTGILAVFLLSGLLKQHGPEHRGSLRQFLTWFVLPVVALSLPWFIKAAWYTGNPAYPLLYRWFGGPDWSPTLATQLTQLMKGIGMGRTVTDYLLLPFRVILMGDVGYAHFDGRICRWWVLLIPMTLVFGMRQPLVRRCLAAAGLYFVAWSLTSQQVRFLIPILPLLSIAAAVTINDLVERVRHVRRRAILASACLIAAGLTAMGVNLGNCGKAAAFLGNLHSQGSAVRQTAIAPVYQFINEKLPADARLLCLNTNQGFFLNRGYLADSCFEASQIADWLRTATSESEIRERLAARGITHILIENRDWGITWPPALQAMLSDRNQARPVYRSSDGAFSVLALALGVRRP
jgi:hypothetical protein